MKNHQKVKQQKIVLLCQVALWFGKKPNFHTFLMSFVEQCNELQQHGMQWNHNGSLIHSRVFFPLFTADSMGRPLVQGFKHHNGYYGCPWCLCPGQRDEVSLVTSNKFTHFETL